MSKEKRLFLGFPGNSDTRDLINQFIEANNDLPVKWIEADNWHITVLFIGDFPADKLPKLKDELNKFFNPKSSFTIEPWKFTYAPKLTKARMIWLKFRSSEAFNSLVQETHGFMEGFYRDHEIPFNLTLRSNNIPHITLSRFKPINAKNKEKLNDAFINGKLKVPVEQVSLFESHLHPDGAQYEILSSYDLKHEQDH